MCNQLITRKDIAAALKMGVRAIERNEKAWGLDAARVYLSDRLALYDPAIVNQKIQEHRGKK
jgi:hypothetical protein